MTISRYEKQTEVQLLQNQIWSTFHGICINCGGKASSLHEIVPRSKLPNSWASPDNIVPLCTPCHELVQSDLTTFAPLLREKRLLWLSILGSPEFEGRKSGTTGEFAIPDEDLK
jgi:5-methylcytosine-specific restriction endonuclease McrA